MFIHVLSPHNGETVKIRQQDIGRAVRDSQGEIFYVLPRSDGKGYYASPIRAQNPKLEQRYQEIEAKTEQARQFGKQQSQAQIHDASGRRRSSRTRLLLLTFILLLLAALAWALTVGPMQHLLFPQRPGGSSPSVAPAPLSVEPVAPPQVPTPAPPAGAAP